jgi:hypothetical protein
LVTGYCGAHSTLLLFEMYRYCAKEYRSCSIQAYCSWRRKYVVCCAILAASSSGVLCERHPGAPFLRNNFVSCIFFALAKGVCADLLTVLARIARGARVDTNSAYGFSDRLFARATSRRKAELNEQNKVKKRDRSSSTRVSIKAWDYFLQKGPAQALTP